MAELDDALVDAPDETPDPGEAEPKPVTASLTQDNVTEPGVQRTVHPDGTEQRHGDPAEDVAVAEDAAPGTPPNASTEPPVSTTEDVTVGPLKDGAGWTTFDVDPSEVASVKVPDDATFTATATPDANDATQTCVTIEGAPADLTEAVVTLVLKDPSAA